MRRRRESAASETTRRGLPLWRRQRRPRREVELLPADCKFVSFLFVCVCFWVTHALAMKIARRSFTSEAETSEVKSK